MENEPNFVESLDAYPPREFKVQFVGGPYDGREGVLPFLPTFMAIHDMDGEWCTKKDGKLIFDERLSEYVYMRLVPREDDSPIQYVLRPRIDVNDFFANP